MSPQKIAWFATKGTGSNEAQRIEWLTSGLSDRVELPFQKSAKLSSFVKLWRKIVAERPALIVMEGTGIAGGLASMFAHWLMGIPYVVSSGDAVGPFISSHHAWAGPLFEWYERCLCRAATGFIGWTPYLCGRAMAFGTRRTVTAPGWVIGGEGGEPVDRSAIRMAWGVPDSAIVVGLVGSLMWNRRYRWCYGMDLVRAAKTLERKDLVIVIVGGGSGWERLRKEAGTALGKTVFLPGPVPLEEVTKVLRAMDVGSLPQSVDAVGAYRYTTKLPEYASCGLPVITNQIPVAYDLGLEWMWRLPGDAPWETRHVDALAALLKDLSPEKIEAKRSLICNLGQVFDRDMQRARVAAFLSDILASSKGKNRG
jgi:hypothetical protein